MNKNENTHLGFKLDVVNYLEFKKAYLSARNNGGRFVIYHNYQISFAHSRNLLRLWEEILERRGVVIVDRRTNTCIGMRAADFKPVTK